MRTKIGAKFNSNIRYLIDLIFVLLSLPIFLPLSLVVAIAIFLDSGFPIFFVQERVGKNHQKFGILKFRTMTTEHQHNGILITSTHDKRITPSGKFLRKWKLDELPQLINVLRNQMSLIGPRPEVEYYVRKWPITAQKEILMVKPGLVDPFTLEILQEEFLLSQTENPEKYYLDVLLPQKMLHYQAYIRNRTLVRDYSFLIKALLITFTPRKLPRKFNTK